MESRLAAVIEIARDAGRLILHHYHSPERLADKEDGSLLTLADVQANDLIVKKLTGLTPGIPIVTEESAQTPYSERKSWSSFWLVDPLDGTAEFLEKNGEFTVNIALIENGAPTLGVIFAPALSLLYYAQDGHGSWKQRGLGPVERIYSNEPDPKGSVRVAVSRRHGTDKLYDYLKNLPVEELIQAGSSLKFCLVAEGRADIYPRLGPTMEWDVAAGDCIYRNSARSGRRRTAFTYNKPDLRNGDFVLGKSLPE